MSKWSDYVTGAGLRFHDAAERFMVEFGDLKVMKPGPRMNHTRTNFRFDSMAAEGDEDRFVDWSEALGRSLCPIGSVEDECYLLGMDEYGVGYVVSNILRRFGDYEEMLEMLVRGAQAEELFADE